MAKPLWGAVEARTALRACRALYAAIGIPAMDAL